MAHDDHNLAQITMAEFGPLLFQCIALFSSRAQVRTLARVVDQGRELEPHRSQRLAELARREMSLTEEINKLIPYLDQHEREYLLQQSEAGHQEGDEQDGSTASGSEV